jgi:S-ribosylhomocysteine lyase
MTDAVESFEFDHRTLTAPFIRIAGSGLGGCNIAKYDLRFVTPNQGSMDTDGLHSLEHMLAVAIREHRKGVVDISPMGCRTGFYLTEIGAPDLMGVGEALRKALKGILDFTNVPAANEEQCGNWKDHDILKAKGYARLFLAALK